MLSDSAATHQTNGNGLPPGDAPIDIPAHSIFLGLFVELLEGRELTSLDDVGQFHAASRRRQDQLSFVKGLLIVESLLRRFDCSHAIRERAVSYTVAGCTADPWFAFCIAAAAEDFIMARQEISRFWTCGPKRKVDPTTMKLADVETLPIEWYLGYARAYHRAKVSVPAVSACPALSTGVSGHRDAVAEPAVRLSSLETLEPTKKHSGRECRLRSSL